MTKPVALANSVTIVWVIAYVLCAIIAFIAPNMYFGVLGTWGHSLNIDMIKSTTPMSLQSTFIGTVTFGIYIWIVTFAIAKLYNRFTK